MPAPTANDLEILSTNAQQTRGLGARLGALLQPGHVVCLQGDLGAGKTTFVQGLAAGWGSLDEVSSPTFILVNVYRRADGRQLFHFDTYRIESAPEAEELDLEAMLGSGPLVIEWPEQIDHVLPAERLWIRLEYVDDERRRLTFTPSGAAYSSLLDEYRAAGPEGG